jgi:branched-subunit amino acid aminotransferase/4-amino-4-deoxychorismate lyase
MVYREGRSPVDVAWELYGEARELEAGAALDKAEAQAALARAQAMLEVAWAEHGAVTALERHLQAMSRAAKAPSSAEAAFARRTERVRADLARAKKKIEQGEAAVAEARATLEKKLDHLAERTRARMAAQAELEKLHPESR